MTIINRENLRDALIAVAIGVTAYSLSGCAARQPPPVPTAAQLAPEPGRNLLRV
jgi:hypothetical protein